MSRAEQSLPVSGVVFGCRSVCFVGFCGHSSVLSSTELLRVFAAQGVIPGAWIVVLSTGIWDPRFEVCGTSLLFPFVDFCGSPLRRLLLVLETRVGSKYHR